MRTANLVLAAVLGAGVAGGIALGVYLEGGGRSRVVYRDPPNVERTPDEAQDTFAQVAEFVLPSVVHITREGVEESRWPWRTEPTRSVGSGVVVSEDGYILTNSHVVRSLERPRIVVKTYEGLTYTASIIGMDEESDLALLKVDADADWVPARIGDSDAVRVGDWVLAIGSPFELSQSVTAGIVSAKGRQADLTVYEDFIQTDAAINPGNSGGALVNMRGEVIGITTAILAPEGSFTGIGYAIPSNLAVWVKDQLLEHGQVQRGFLGLGPTDVNEALVQAMEGSDITSLGDILADLGLERPYGAYVARVLPSGPARAAGIREGDVIVTYDGREVQGAADLMLRVAETRPETTVRLSLIRNRQPMEVSVTLSRRPTQDEMQRLDRRP